MLILLETPGKAFGFTGNQPGIAGNGGFQAASGGSINSRKQNKRGTGDDPRSDTKEPLGFVFFRVASRSDCPASFILLARYY
jgi:hypothetical protein